MPFKRHNGDNMKKKSLFILLTVFLIAIALTAVAGASAAMEDQPAFAEQVNAPDGGCQVGANNEIVGEWQLFNQEEFALYLEEAFDYSEGDAEERAAAVWAFCDHNNDDLACVMEQNLPNDASGRSSYWLVEDNHPYGGK